MPSSSHPQAQFVPISPDFDLHSLVEGTSNFDYVTRLSTEKLKEHSIQSFEALVLAVVIQSGKPLVIEDWGESLPPWLFSPTWLQENMGTKPEMIRDIPNAVNIPMTMGHYLRSMETLTNRITPATYRDAKRQRLYMKDIDCPEQWFNHLKEVMPESVFYFNDCIEPRTGGDGAIREPNEYGQMVYGKGVAPAGDLMSSLPAEMRALNMMCYIGHEGTYTPAHREMCASLGHNIMVEASENRKGEKAGSSIWFMTETKEREVVSEYFLSMLGHDIEVEKHFAQLNAWKKAPFNVWVVEQKVGDLILIPPLAPHQVWNRGTRTMKAAWNRTTVDTLELALHEALPRARMVCREEQYKNKAMVYYTLIKYHDLLQRDTVEPKMWKYGRIKQVLEDFKRLFALYSEILVSEMFSPKLPEEENVEYLEYDSNVTCSYCRGNIFNRFLTCKSCIQTAGDIEDTYDVCMDCYAMGRSCACISNLSWVEQWSWHTLIQNYEKWRATVIQFDGFFDKYRSPQPLDIARKQYGRKPVAEVCQEQLRIRPWKDITQPDPEPALESEEEPEVDDDGRVKKKKKRSARTMQRKVVPTKNKTTACHICCHHDLNWKLAFCTTCTAAYCYGTLWRAFDLMPQTVMEDKEWSCPRCLKICSCGRCRKNPKQIAYAPKGTLLGHDTKKVADYRSVESLVDFSRPNVSWLRGENEVDPQETARMKRLRAQADADKGQDLVDPENRSYLQVPEAANYELGAMGQGNDAAISTNGNHDLSLSNAQNGDYSYNDFGDEQVYGANAHMSMHSSDPGLATNWLDNNGQGEASNTNGREQASYPTGLLAPGQSGVHDDDYSDPTHVGHGRMMGAGYYQQGSGADQILFDAPDGHENTDEPQRSDPKKNPNFLFSDLLDPALQGEDVKKRKRAGDEEEEEFFLSKKQKKAAKEKQVLQDYGIEDDPLLTTQHGHRQPRRSTGTTTYIDLGEEAVPIEDDEGPSIIQARTTKAKAEYADSDMDLAAKALNRLSKKTSVEGSVKKRGRPKGTAGRGRSSQSGSPAPNTIKTPRKSAWLARKEAADRGEDMPAELGPRTRRPRSSLQQVENASEIIDISSGAEESDIDRAFSEEETDSLFGEPIPRRHDESEADGEIDNTSPTSEVEDQSDVTAQIQAEIIIGSPAPTPSTDTIKPPPRRRGRPPKNAASTENIAASSNIDDPPAATRMLSLKERLALKGKNAKIVAKNGESVHPPAEQSSASATPTIQLRSILRNGSGASSTHESSPVQTPAWSKFGAVDEPSDDADGADDKADDEWNLDDISPIDPSPAHHGVTFESPPPKGPTVVRLMSPTPDDSDEEHIPEARSKSYETSSDDDSGSDVSIPAVKPSPLPAARGQPSIRGFGDMRGGMPAKRRRGRPPGSKNRS